MCVIIVNLKQTLDLLTAHRPLFSYTSNIAQVQATLFMTAIASLGFNLSIVRNGNVSMQVCHSSHSACWCTDNGACSSQRPKLGGERPAGLHYIWCFRLHVHVHVQRLDRGGCCPGSLLGYRIVRSGGKAPRSAAWKAQAERLIPVWDPSGRLPREPKCKNAQMKPLKAPIVTGLL